MKTNMIDLLAYRCTYWEGKLYCLASDFNLLFSVDLQDGTVKPIDVIPEENILTAYICGAINVWNGKLILTPSQTKKIWIYDLASGQWDGLAIREYEHWGSGGIFQTYVYNNKIFLIGGSYPAIIRLDLETNSCDYIEEPYKEVLARQPEINHHYFRIYGARCENTLYLASCLDNFVLKFDMETCEHRWIKVGDDNHTYSGITWDGNNFWLSPRLNSDIVKWDGKEEVNILPLSPESETDAQYIWEGCYNGKQIVFFCSPPYPENSVFIDLQNDTFEFSMQQYSLFTRFDNGMAVSQTTNGNLSIITEGSSPKTFHTAIDCDHLTEFYKQKNRSVFNSQTLCHEVPKHPLLSLDAFLTLTEPESHDRPASGGQIGKTIWEAIR